MGGPVASADGISDEARFLQLINTDRALAGVAPLSVAPRLGDFARAWSRLLLERSTSLTECAISHNQNLLEVLRPAAKVAENVGCGDSDADAMHGAFMNSLHHRMSILDPSFDSVGVGVVKRGDTMFVTVEFVRNVEVDAPPLTLVPLPNLAPPATLVSSASAPAAMPVSVLRVSRVKPKPESAKSGSSSSVSKVLPKKSASGAPSMQSKLRTPSLPG